MPRSLTLSGSWTLDDVRMRSMRRGDRERCAPERAAAFVKEAGLICRVESRCHRVFLSSRCSSRCQPFWRTGNRQNPNDFFSRSAHEF